MSRRRRPAGARRKHPSGHPGRGEPRVSPAQRRRAHGAVAATSSPGEGVRPTRGTVRINRWLAERGVASRRRCDQLVQEGSVAVNGRIVLEPGYQIAPEDRVTVDGKPVRDIPRLYYLFYKPKGVLCTDDPREGRTRVCDLVAPLVAGRVYTVGRLDESSEGLLLLTNDGDFAQLVAHPRHGIPKTYVVQTSGPLDADSLRRIRSGVWIADGKVRPERVRLLHGGARGAAVEVVLREGRNREIRRLFARVGVGVKALKRVRIGEIGVKGLRRGTLRPLTRAERDGLVALARLLPSSPRRSDRRPA